MKQVAIMVTHAYYDENSNNIYAPMVRAQVSQLEEAMEKLKIALIPIFWEDDNNDWSKFDLVLPLMAWDYPSNQEQFLKVIDEIAYSKVKLLNSPEIIKENMNKSYLTKLYKMGAKVPKTLEFNMENPQEILNAFEIFDCDEIIIKPNIGAGAWRQARLKKGETLPNKDLLPPQIALVQPFISSVATIGELSMLFMGGEFSHALMKTPKQGDYRSQTKYGATENNIIPPPNALKAAKQILEQYDPKNELLYARIDMVELDNDWLLMEMELIEPYLYGPFDGENGNKSATNFANAVLKVL